MGSSRPLPFYPSRILDLGDQEKVDNPNNFLKSTIFLRKLRHRNRGFGPYFDGTLRRFLQHTKADYVALSYRWGTSSQNLLTTSATLQSHCQGIDFNNLPKTIQDAVIVTRHLRIRYLWIDALCIIQDSWLDWLYEASEMKDVYTNAFLTLAAHAAEHADDGFLSKTMKVPKTIPLGKNFGAKEEGKLFSISTHHKAEEDIDGSTMSSRGWVLQERLLSRQTIHFLPSRIYWEDVQGIFAEDGAFSIELNRSEIIHGCAPPNNIMRKKNLSSRYWFEIIERYSACHLTKETDKLVAISGIAKQMYKQIQIKYFCGIWCDLICEYLLWMCADKPVKRYGPLNLRSTWSWASVEGAVRFPLWVMMPPNYTKSSFTPVIEPKLYEWAASAPDEDLLDSSTGDMSLLITGFMKEGLRFAHGAPGKLRSREKAFVMKENKWPMFLWDLFDGEGRCVEGWASFDEEKRDKIDGVAEEIACLRVAMHAGHTYENEPVGSETVIILLVVRVKGDRWRRVGVGQVFEEEDFGDAEGRTIILV